MCNLKIIVRCLTEASIMGELWIGNSFITDKINARDLDMILCVKEDSFNKATSEQREVFDWISSNLENSHGCDSKLLIQPEVSSPNYGEREWDKISYLSIFGFYHPEGPNVHERKGIAVLNLPGCMP